MRSTLVKLALGCGLAVAFAAPTMACEFYKQTVKNDQAVAQSQQTDARSCPNRDAPDCGIPTGAERWLELTKRQGSGR